jgi:hypothetical protein
MGDGGEATGGSGSIEIPSARAVPFPAASETEDSDYMLEIERELFVPSSIDSDAEVEEELFVSLPISPATEIPSVPLLAEPSPAILQTKAVESPPSRTHGAGRSAKYGELGDDPARWEAAFGHGPPAGCKAEPAAATG